MTRIIAKVGTREVISTASIIAHTGENICIYPFMDDSDFEINIKLDLNNDNDINGTNVIIWDEETHPTLKLTRQFKFAHTTTNGAQISFAQDEEYEYFINYTLIVIGRIEKYSVNFNYTILRLKK